MSTSEQPGDIVERIVEAGDDANVAFITFLQSPAGQIPDIVLRVLELVAEALASADRIASHVTACEVAMCIGAMLERGAPCAEAVAPHLLARVQRAMRDALDGQADAIESLERFYVPIVACFSVCPALRVRPLPRDLLDLLDRAVEVAPDLSWLKRLFAIRDDELLAVLEPGTGRGAVYRLVGISDMAQAHCILARVFPGASESAAPSRRSMHVATWQTWRGSTIGANLDRETLALSEAVGSFDIGSQMISQEASMDEIDFLDLPVQIGDATPARCRTLVLGPPLYVRGIEPDGVFQCMRPDLELVKELSRDEVRACLRFLVDQQR